MTTTQQLLSHTTRQECVAIRRSSPVPQAWELLWRATYGGGVRCQRRVMASSDRRRTGGAGRRPELRAPSSFSLRQEKSLSQQGASVGASHNKSFLPRILLWSPSTTTGTRRWGAARPGRPLSRAGTPARDPRGLCLPEPGAARRTGPRAMQRRGAVEGGGPRTEQRRNHTSRQDRLWTGRPIGSRLRGAVSPRRRLRAVLPCCADEQQPGRRAGRHNLSRLWTPRRRCSTRPRPHSPPARA